MKIKKFNEYYIVRLEKNDEIIATLENVAKNAKIKGAFFFGLGVGKNLILGYYDAHKKSYIKKVFKGEYEFTGLSGNISKLKDETIVHCHATITDSNFNAFGGHLFHATVPTTLEIALFPVKKILKRKNDKNIGLNLLDL